MGGIELLILVVVAVVGGAIWSLVGQRRNDAVRARAFQDFAITKGWRFEGKEPATRKELGLPFGWGSQSQRNFVRGTLEGVPFILFDFLISTKNNRMLRTWAAFELPPDYPKFRVIPNSFAYMLDR